MRWRRTRRGRQEWANTSELSVEDAVVAALFPAGNFRIL